LDIPDLFIIITSTELKANTNTQITTTKMKTFTAASTAAIALTCLFQACPAPPIALAAIGITAGEAGAIGAGVAGGLGGGAIAGGIGAAKGHGKRQDNNSLPPVAAAACKQQLHGVTVQVSKVGANDVRFDNVPPACMTLANVFLGQNTPGQAHPILMGSASLQYNGLTADELKVLQNALDVYQQGH